VHQAEPLIAIQGELDLAAGCLDGDRGLGRPGLVGSMWLRMGSFPGGSSFLVQGKATSSRATGREELPSSLFNWDRDTLRPMVQQADGPRDRLARPFAMARMIPRNDHAQRGLHGRPLCDGGRQTFKVTVTS
jgi:hypothetical protein